MVKVLVVAPVPFFVDRGTPMRILEEALALEKKEIDINIVSYHLGRDIKTVAPETKIKNFRIRGIMFWYNKEEAGPNWQKIILDMLLIWKTLKISFLKKPDIIHAHLHEGVLVGWIVKKILFWRKIKLVADFHGGLVSEMQSHGYLNGGFLKKIFSFLENLIFSLGDWTIASSGELKGKINKIREKKNISTVLDGVSLDKYNLKEKENNDRNKLKVVYSGAFVVNKGINLLLDSILEISKKNLNNISFILAGGPIENIENFIKDNKLEKIVKVISPLDYRDLPEVNKRGDIAIDPKTSEVGQASGKILQYMAAGLPVICFDRENNRKYLGGAGYYVSEKSSEKITESIMYFLNNPDKIEPMSKISRKRAGDFSWEKSAKKIINIYNKIHPVK